MKLLASCVLIATLISGTAFCQTGGSSVYKDLDTKKFYRLSYSSRTQNGVATYEINGKKVSESTYNNYHSTWQNMETCTPCKLQQYDLNDVLIREAVVYQDCGVGVFKEYFPDGKTVKLSGSYRENETGDWEDIYDRGYCNVENGQWVYYDKKGDTLYSEFWNNGDFVKQVPEQKTIEIWKVEVTLDGESVQDKTLTSAQLKQLIVTPRYKNSSVAEEKLTVTIEATAIGYRQAEQTVDSDKLDEINIKKMLNEAGIPSSEKPDYMLYVYNGSNRIAYFEFQVSN